MRRVPQITSPPKGIRILDHTADIGLEVHGADLAELFANAARGMFQILVSPETVKPIDEFPVEVTAQSPENLLLNWLSELLYLFSAKALVLARFEIIDIDCQHVSAKCFGQTIDQSRHELHTEIKAVTYHDLKVEKLDEGFRAQVLFDI